MTTGEDLRGATPIGEVYEPEATKRRRELTALIAERAAARAKLDKILARHKADRGPFTDADLRLIIANPGEYVTGSTIEGAASALLARKAATSHPEAKYLGLDAVRTDAEWLRVAYVLDAQQTVLAVIDESTESVLAHLLHARRAGDKPFWRQAPELADKVQPDLLSIELAVAYGTPRSMHRWLGRIFLRK